jgi:hypothetical protein
MPIPAAITVAALLLATPAVRNPTVSARRTVEIDLHSLRVPMLYAALDRPDLVARYERRRTVKTAVATAGGVAAGIGVAWGLARVASSVVEAVAQGPCLSSSDTSCGQRREMNDTPWILASAGLVTTIVALSIPADPLSRAQREALISGEPVPEEPPPRPPAPGENLFSFAAAPTPGGAALLATRRF